LVAVGLAVIFARLPNEAAQADTLLQKRHFAEAEEVATRALVRAPLDWRIYFTRAGARACRNETLEAVADFRRARRLEPHYAGLPLSEGQFWIASQPGLALIAWREALHRAPPPGDGDLYGTMLGAAPNDPGFRARLLALAQDRPVLQLKWFQAAPPVEARAQLARLSAAAQHWPPEQRALFQRRAEEIAEPPAHP
jgi:hypothetical protein